MIQTKRRPNLLAQCRQIIAHSASLLRAAGLPDSPETVRELVRGAPQTVAEGDSGSTCRRSLCIIALLAASDNPMSDWKYLRFRKAAQFWLDAWPLIAPARRKRLQAMIDTVLGGFEDE